MNDNQLIPVAKCSISFLLFAPLDELPTLKQGFKKWFDFISTFENKIEVIVVAYGSIKSESDLFDLKESMQKNAPKILCNSINFLESISESEGDALRVGFENSKYNIVLVSPALARFCQPTVLKTLFENLEQSHIAGVARVFETYPWWLRIYSFLKGVLCRLFLCMPVEKVCGSSSIMGRAKSWLFWFIYGIRYQDSFSPLRLYRREVLSSCLPSSKGNFWNVEVLAKANFIGAYSFTELHLPESDSNSNKSIISFCGDKWFWSDFYRLLLSPSFSPFSQSQNMNLGNNPLPSQMGRQD